MSHNISGLRVKNGGPKGERKGNCAIGVIFVINRNFLENNVENQKKFHETKCACNFYFTYAVQISLGSVKNG